MGFETPWLRDTQSADAVHLRRRVVAVVYGWREIKVVYQEGSKRWTKRAHNGSLETIKMVY